MNEESFTFGGGEFHLAMPFVCVTSKGGPYDDAAFAAGWEMGTLDALLASGPTGVVQSIRRASLDQADLIAMRHGYIMVDHGGIGDEATDIEWANVSFKIGVAP